MYCLNAHELSIITLNIIPNPLESNVPLPCSFIIHCLLHKWTRSSGINSTFQTDREISPDPHWRIISWSAFIKRIWKTGFNEWCLIIATEKQTKLNLIVLRGGVAKNVLEHCIKPKNWAKWTLLNKKTSLDVFFARQ